MRRGSHLDLTGVTRSVATLKTLNDVARASDTDGGPMRSIRVYGPDRSGTLGPFPRLRNILAARSAVLPQTTGAGSLLTLLHAARAVTSNLTGFSSTVNAPASVMKPADR